MILLNKFDFLIFKYRIVSDEDTKIHSSRKLHQKSKLANQIYVSIVQEEKYPSYKFLYWNYYEYLLVMMTSVPIYVTIANRDI